VRIESVRFETSGMASIAMSGGFLFLIPLTRVIELPLDIFLSSGSDRSAMSQEQAREAVRKLPDIAGEFHQEDELFISLQHIDEETRAFSKAYELCGIAEQNSQGLYRKLQAKGFSRRAIQKAIEKAQAEGLVDDARFARIWARRRVEKTLCGPKTLIAELALRGISAEDARQALLDIPFDIILEGAYMKTIRKLSKKYSGPNLVQEAYRQLRQEGFDSESLKNLIDSEKNSL